MLYGSDDSDTTDSETESEEEVSSDTNNMVVKPNRIFKRRYRYTLSYHNWKKKMFIRRPLFKKRKITQVEKNVTNLVNEFEVINSDIIEKKVGDQENASQEVKVNQEEASQEEASQEDASQEDVSQEDTSQEDTGHEEENHEDTSHEEASHEDTGHEEDTSHEDTSHEEENQEEHDKTPQKDDHTMNERQCTFILKGGPHKGKQCSHKRLKGNDEIYCSRHN